jgi:hypothetical protein
MPQPNPPHLDSKSVADYIDGQMSGYFAAGNSGAAISLDLGKGLNQQVVLTASGPTITLTNAKVVGASGPSLAQRARILLKQDATGSRTLPTFSPALNYGTAGAPTLTVTAAKTDILELLSLDGGVTWFCTSVTKGF